jgi:hypothetical protein
MTRAAFPPFSPGRLRYPAVETLADGQLVARML